MWPRWPRTCGNERLRAKFRCSTMPSAAAVPADLRARLGAAQFAAALAGLRTALDLDRSPPYRSSPGRPLTADERRLLADVPPHHGT